MPDIEKNVFRKIFLDNWDKFLKLYASYCTPYYLEVIQKMLRCGKEEGGYCEYICLHCGRDRRRVAFTCKSNFCLSCAKVYTDNFVSQVSRMLQPGVKYRHIVLTVPDVLRKFFYNNRKSAKILKKFMPCGYKCLEDVVSTALKQMVKIGAIIVVQTNGRSGHFNPHLHVIMTSGGINELTGKWVELKFLPYEIIRKKWQYHLFKMLQEVLPTPEMKSLINELYKKYPNGLVTHVTKGEVPNRCKGLAGYLARYVTSPPIAISRILSYTGSEVTYCYDDHKTKKKEIVTVDVMTFIGRMVQHILPKGFQRVRYYGLIATKTMSKWAEAIKEGLRRIGRVIKGTYEVVAEKTYRERYKDTTGRDPLKCRFCGTIMDLWRVWHPKYGLIYDESEKLKAGHYETTVDREDTTKGRDRHSLRPSAEGIPLPLRPLWG